MSNEFTKTPVFIYLVLAGFSTISALLFFHVGGSLAEMVGKPGYGISFKAGGALAGFLIVFWLSLLGIERLYGIQPILTGSVDGQQNLPKSYHFPTVVSEISETLQRLEADDSGLSRIYVDRGDGERLFDGLYSSLLYASSAAVTGIVDPRFYGNMMEWDVSAEQLRVRYFAGPYNDEIITRNFPIHGPGQGVASEAFKTQQIKVKNKMESELKEKGEARLYAMSSIPVENTQAYKSRQVVILNVDAGIADVFPVPEEWITSDVKMRFDQLAKLIARVNILYRKYMEEV